MKGSNETMDKSEVQEKYDGCLQIRNAKIIRSY